MGNGGDSSIEVTLNGKPYRTAAGTSVAELVAGLNLVPEQVAVELNRCLIGREQRCQTRLGQGDMVELVTLVGGG
jgi:thiamine biosynthesis protein ThiS